MLFFLLIVSLVLVYSLYRYQRKVSNILSGLKDVPVVKGLPVLGILFEIQGSLSRYLVKLSETCGPIYKIKFGLRDIVVLNNFECIKAALVDNRDTFSGRPKVLKYVYVCNKSGLIFIDGNVWSQQRHFVLKTLKDFGMGRSKSEQIVHEECMQMLDKLKNLKGKSVDFSSFIPIYSANVILKFNMNKRYTHDDPEFQEIERTMAVLNNKNDPIAYVLMLFPFIENVEWLMKFIIWSTSRKSIIDNVHKIIEKEIENHSQRLDVNSEGDDLIDRFLITQHQSKNTKNDYGSFTDWQLIRDVTELLAAGYDTTSSTFIWSFMFMAMYPEIQDKVHEEIVDRIGHERLPSMSDKVSLNYTQAVMDEIMRLSSVTSLSIWHRTINDVNIKGYFIPRDTVVITNLFACHLDPKIWERSLEFYPEHFLLADSNGEVKYRPRQELITFGIGKRQCLGESLARIMFFIYFTSILQRFQVSMTKESSKDRHFDVFNTNDKVIRAPNVKDFTFKKREK